MVLRLFMTIIAVIPITFTDSVYVITRYEPQYLMDQIEEVPVEFSSNPEEIIPQIPFNIISSHKRAAQTVKSLPSHEHVCQTIIKTDYEPQFGHEQNGTRVEIQQDDRRKFRATFIECESSERNECHGIDNALFSSECVTLYEFRPAGVRIAGSASDFVEGLIKVPITCQCRLRRKLNRLLIADRP